MKQKEPAAVAHRSRPETISAAGKQHQGQGIPRPRQRELVTLAPVWPRR